MRPGRDRIGRWRVPRQAKLRSARDRSEGRKAMMSTVEYNILVTMAILSLTAGAVAANHPDPVDDGAGEEPRRWPELTNRDCGAADDHEAGRDRVVSTRRA